MSRATLRFHSAALEAAFVHYWDTTRAHTHDSHGAAVYFAMVFIGGILLMAGRAFDPLLGDGCDWLVLWSCLVPLSHLLLLKAAPTRWYRDNRTAITLAYRAAYLAFTSPPSYGLGACPVGSYSLPKEVPRVGESAFSALLWRSGVIGLWWYPSAFPLLLRHHVPVQALFFAAYAGGLAGAACSDLKSVMHGEEAVRWLGRAMAKAQELFFAAHGGWAARSGPGGGSLAAPIGCRQAVIFAQLVTGLLLPTFVLYCTEAHARASWLRRERAAMRARRWRAAALDPAARDPGGGGEAAGGCGWLDQGGSDRMASQHTDNGQQQQQQQQPSTSTSPCPSPRPDPSAPQRPAPPPAAAAGPPWDCGGAGPWDDDGVAAPPSRADLYLVFALAVFAWVAVTQHAPAASRLLWMSG